MGDPALLRRAEAVSEFNTPALDALIEDMFETMAACDGAGLAAPQIDIGLRIVIFGVDHTPRYPDAVVVPQTVIINPQIMPLRDEMDEDWEGCLSVPGMRGLVPRFTHIHYKGFDQQGRAFEREVTGFHARVVQHECDHLDGILYPQRIQDMRYFGFTEELFAEGSLGNPGLPCDDVKDT
jgi:peptide deformylase